MSIPRPVWLEVKVCNNILPIQIIIQIIIDWEFTLSNSWILSFITLCSQKTRFTFLWLILNSYFFLLISCQCHNCPEALRHIFWLRFDRHLETTALVSGVFSCLPAVLPLASPAPPSPAWVRRSRALSNEPYMDSGQRPTKHPHQSLCTGCIHLRLHQPALLNKRTLLCLHNGWGSVGKDGDGTWGGGDNIHVINLET